MAKQKKRKTKRRGNGKGSIFQRADGRWVGRVSTGYAANGKRITRTVYGTTKREVMDKLAELQNRQWAGTLTDSDKLTVAEYLSRWLEGHARDRVRESTYENYETMVRIHINPIIGGKRFTKIMPADIDGLLGMLKQQKKSARIRQLVYSVVHQALAIAVNQRTLPSNPCSVVDAPKYHKPEIHPLNAEQAREFLHAADGDRLEALYVLALTTGMRQGEILALHWCDVDLQSGYLSVRHTLRWRKGEPVLSPPTSKKGRRKIELSGMVITALHEHREQMLAEGHAGCEWVFCSSTGNPLDKTNLVRRSFKPMLKRVDAQRAEDAEKRGVRPEPFPVIRFHDLRHTAATLMLLNGDHPKVVQERLGHATISITLDTYSHVLPSMQQESAAKMDRLLSVGIA